MMLGSLENIYRMGNPASYFPVLTGMVKLVTSLFLCLAGTKAQAVRQGMTDAVCTVTHTVSSD